MSLELVKELWSGLKPIIQHADMEEASDILLNVLIDNDIDSAEIKELFRRDKEIMAALKYYNEHEEENQEEEEYEEDNYEDEDY